MTKPMIHLDPTQLSVTELCDQVELAIQSGHDVRISIVPNTPTQNCVDYPILGSKKYQRPRGRDFTSRELVEMLQQAEARERPWWRRVVQWLVMCG